MLRLARACARPGQRRLSSLRQRIPGCGWRSIVLDEPAPAAAALTAQRASVRVRDSEQHRADDDHIPPTLLTWLRLSATHAVLPKGYPHTVRSTYPLYVRWTAVGLLTGRIQSLLATQAMLFTIGLGTGAIPMAAAIQWVLKDGIGHAGAIAYAAAVNTRFDADAKRYRFQSTVALTLSDFIAIAMPLAPQYFLPLASLSSAIGSIAGLAQTASRARVMSAFALGGNLADCTRAGQTQGKLMSIVGTSAGAYLSWLIGPDPYRVALCMLPLAALSLYSMHASSALVVLRSLNVQRAERLFRDLLLQLPGGALARGAAAGGVRFDVPTPEQVAALETFAVEYVSVFHAELVLQPLLGGPPTGGWRLALPFARAIDSSVAALILGGQRPLPAAHASAEWAASWHAGSTYAIAVHRPADPSRWAVYAWHTSRSTPLDKLCAVWHSCVLRHAIDERGGRPPDLDAAHAAAAELWPAVQAALEGSDWALSTVYLDGDGAYLEVDGGHADGGPVPKDGRGAAGGQQAAGAAADD